RLHSLCRATTDDDQSHAGPERAKQRHDLASQPKSCIDIRPVPESTSEDDRPRLLTVRISFYWDFNAKWVDPHALSKLRGHGLNYRRIARRENLDAFETTPHGRLIFLPPAPLGFT